MDEAVRQHLPLSVPVYQILLSLIDRTLHGYAVIQDVRERTGGEVELTASTLYGALPRMLDTGMVRESDPPADLADADARRRYYKITPFGRAVARAEVERLERALAQARTKALWASPTRPRDA